LGNKLLIDPELIKPLRAVRARALAVASQIGMPFMKGWLAPLALASSIEPTLAAMTAEFNALVGDLCASLDAYLDDWRDKPNHQAWRDLLDNSRPTPDAVRREMCFDYTFLLPSAPLEGLLAEKFQAKAATVAGSLNDQAFGLLNGYLQDIAGKDKLKRDFRRMEAVCDRLDALTYSDASVLESSKMADLMLAKLKSGVGSIVGVELDYLRKVLTILADEFKTAENESLVIEPEVIEPTDQPAEAAALLAGEQSAMAALLPAREVEDNAE
jgi:hypothetical protein